MLAFFDWVWSVIPRGTEFWSAITGALVGGMIAFVVQMIALRAAKKQGSEDYKLVQQGLGNSLLFKMIRVHLNFQAIHHHIEACFEGAGRRGLVGEPWQFVLPLANPPNPIHFSSEEMGMLLAQRDDEVFNAVLSIDVLHNSLIDAVKTLNDRRLALTERIAAGKVEGEVAISGLPQAELLAIRPRMIELNTLIEQLRSDAARAVEESGLVLDRLHTLLRDRLGHALPARGKNRALAGRCYPRASHRLYAAPTRPLKGRGKGFLRRGARDWLDDNSCTRRSRLRFLRYNPG